MMPQDSRWRITAQFGRNQTTITASNQPLADTETADSKQTKTTEDDDKVAGQNANGQNAKLMAWLSSSDCKVILKWQYYDPNGSHSQPLQNHILGKHVDCFSGLVWRQKGVRRERQVITKLLLQLLLIRLFLLSRTTPEEMTDKLETFHIVFSCLQLNN